mmetsp:Transcript_79608/g.234120  ORF Transcript_79608/g.234120 Transcript_79608/m.234120 type:complete len:452 (-) Transcript_79608:91-1446(-)
MGGVASRAVQLSARTAQGSAGRIAFGLAAACGGLAGSAGGPATASCSAAGAEGNEEPCAECVRAAARVFCGGEHTLLRDPETLEVYQLGACGLGFNHDNPTASGPATYVRKVPSAGPVAGVFAGYYHNFLKLTGGGCLAYGCGRQAPNDGQLLNGSLSEDTVPTTTRLRFAEAAAGGHHSICRTRAGEVFASGAGWQGQMGDGSLDYKNAEPRRVAGLPKISRISTGYYHVAALSEEGEWYVWGCNEQAQLGQPGEMPLTQPRLLSEVVPALTGEKVLAFEGGYGHSVLLTEGGRVITMGNHSEGQRALDPDLEDGVPSTHEVAGLPGPAKAVAAGSHHSLAVVNGRVFAFGSDEYGQVSGCGEPSEDRDHRVPRPQAVEGLPDGDPVVRVSAGICHSAAQTASGRVFLWGCGGNGQTGDASLPTSSRTTEVDIGQVVQRCRAQVGQSGER